MPDDQSNPEIANSVFINGIETNYHDVGEGPPVIFIHGSGPGVSSWANWRFNIGPIAERARCIAPDMVGFGYTVAPEGYAYSMANWVKHLKGLIDHLELESVAIVGNSFGGALAIAFAIAHPMHVNKLVLMGSVGVEFDLTYGLNEVWGYEPSVENMKKLLDIFSHDKSLVNDDLAQIRYTASVRDGVQDSFSAMFPEPRQSSVTAMASDPTDIAKIDVPVLIMHGRDDRVIPLSNAHEFFRLLPNAELHIFSNCGHWTQIEKKDRFNAMVRDFVSEPAST